MNRTVNLSLFLAVTATLFSVSPATASDKDRETTSRFCSSHGDLGLSHGGCVAFFTSRNVVPHDASVCRDPDLRARLGVRNVGQCVKSLKDLEAD